MDPIEAQAALDSMTAAQREFAASGPKYPLWRHVAFAPCTRDARRRFSGWVTVVRAGW